MCDAEDVSPEAVDRSLHVWCGGSPTFDDCETESRRPLLKESRLTAANWVC